MPSTTPVIAPNPQLSLSYSDYVEAHFLRLAYGGQMTTIRGGGWTTRADLSAAPGEVLANASYFQHAHDEVLVRVGEALCHLILSDRSLAVRIAARDHATVEQAMSCVRSALAPVERDDREIPVRFWWMAGNGFQQMARMLDAPSWADLCGNYGASTTVRLERLSAWRERPDGSGRLLLFHGAPGTGKTSAIRALAREWRSWAHFHFVTDPEAFLSDPSYLMTVIGGARSSSAAARASKSWRVVVLEDAGEFLALDAGQLNGRALSRLLNVGDGVLG